MLLIHRGEAEGYTSLGVAKSQKKEKCLPGLSLKVHKFEELVENLN